MVTTSSLSDPYVPPIITFAHKIRQAFFTDSAPDAQQGLPTPSKSPALDKGLQEPPHSPTRLSFWLLFIGIKPFANKCLPDLSHEKMMEKDNWDRIFGNVYRRRDQSTIACHARAGERALVGANTIALFRPEVPTFAALKNETGMNFDNSNSSNVCVC